MTLPPMARQAAQVFLLERLLHRRATGAGDGAAISGRLRRHPRRRARHSLREAWPRLELDDSSQSWHFPLRPYNIHMHVPPE